MQERGIPAVGHSAAKKSVSRKANRKSATSNSASSTVPLFEALEDRQLMSLTISVREAGGAASATVTAGQVLNLELVATITSANNNPAQDGLQDVSGSIISTETASKAVAGNLSATNVAPFNANGCAPGTFQDLNGDGNIDIGTNNKTSTLGLFFARSSPEQLAAEGTIVGNTLQFVVADLKYTVTNVNSGVATDINFVPYVSSTPDAAAWSEQSKQVDNISGVFAAGSPFVITGSSTGTGGSGTGGSGTGGSGTGGSGGGTTATPLAGTVIGTSGSYGNSGNTIAKAFDGSLSTYYDGASANGDWAGKDLGSTYKITSVAFAPRSGWASRMVGGVFQGSNSASFSSGVSTLATITKSPTVGVLTTLAVTNTSAFRYVRYLSPNGSYGDVAELQFFGTAATVTGPAKLTGTVIGTSGSYGNSGNTIAKAFDGNLSTYFDGASANGNWAGLDLGSAQTIGQISYAPRSGWASRMVGGIFQASNTANFSSGVVNLYTVTTTPTVGVLTTVTVNVTGTYRYVRYLSPNGSYGDVAEIAFFS